MSIVTGGSEAASRLVASTIATLVARTVIATLDRDRSHAPRKSRNHEAHEIFQSIPKSSCISGFRVFRGHCPAGLIRRKIPGANLVLACAAAMTTDESLRQPRAAPHVDAFPIEDVRRRFPALARAGRFVFFDNAAGAQIPSTVVDAVTDHLLARNVQRGGPYRHSREVDAMIARARARVAAFVNARGADEIAFGLNATSFIRAISLAVGQTLQQRPEIIVSELDHEANVATWLTLERFGARIVWWRVRDADRRLHAADLDPLLSERTRLVACTVASNATGTMVDVAEVGRRAHAVGAEVFLDAVHYAPHGPIDVQAFGSDYLVCSGYKIFAPHMGFVWSRREAINRLPTFREDFIPDVTPDKLEAGTYAYEHVAGMEAAIEYLQQLGGGSVGAAMA